MTNSAQNPKQLLYLAPKATRMKFDFFTHHSTLYSIMFFQTLLRLLPSLLFAACFCQSGMGAVQWEMSWEASVEATFDSTGIAAPDHPENGDCPSIDVCPYSGPMGMRPPTPSGQHPSILFENQSFELKIHFQSLCVLEPAGEAIRVAWRHIKVPICSS